MHANIHTSKLLIISKVIIDGPSWESEWEELGMGIVGNAEMVMQ